MHKRILEGKERKKTLVVQHTPHTHPMCPSPNEATLREIERATNVLLRMDLCWVPPGLDLHFPALWNLKAASSDFLGAHGVREF